MLKFEKTLYILIFLIPFSFALNLQKDVDLASTRVFVSIFFVIFFFYLLYKNKKILIEKYKNKQSFFLMLFVILSSLSMFWAINPVWTARKALFFISIFPFYFLILYIVNSKNKLKKISKVFIISAFISSTIALIQFFSQFIFSLDTMYKFWAYKISMFLYGQNFGTVIINNQSWFVNIGSVDFFRAISLFPDPHTFALYLGIAIPFSIGFSQCLKNKEKKIFLLFSFIMIIALLLTFSRGAYVGLILSLFATILFYKNKIKDKINIKKILFFATLTIILFYNSVFGQRFISSFSMSDVSNIGRIGIWQTSFSVFSENPILGIGLGNLPIYFDPTISIKSPINAHNTYLDLLSELGIIGLVLFIMIFVYSIKYTKLKKDEFNPLRIGVFGSIVWFLSHSFFETSLFSVSVLLSLCFILAMSLLLKNKIENDKISR